jgi:hypothetical protein
MHNAQPPRWVSQGRQKDLPRAGMHELVNDLKMLFQAADRPLNSQSTREVGLQVPHFGHSLPNMRPGKRPVTTLPLYILFIKCVSYLGNNRCRQLNLRNILHPRDLPSYRQDIANLSPIRFHSVPTQIYKHPTAPHIAIG